MINVQQIIPLVQFGYDLRMAKHNLGKVNIGYLLAVTPLPIRHTERKVL